MMDKLTREQYRQSAALKVAAAQEVLAAEVAALDHWEDWRKFLDFQAVLIRADMDDAAMVKALIHEVVH
jgi:hypothetical protein